MRLLTDGSALPATGSMAAVGSFDGVHLGHRYLLRALYSEAQRRGLSAMAVTFRQHPLSVLRPASAPRLLTTLDERLALIEATGVDYCVLLDFTAALARLSAEEFMSQLLRERYNVRALLMGYDHHIGSDREHSFEHYAEAGKAAGVEVVRAAEYRPESGLAVSSSAVRRAVENGEMEKASLMLGRPYNICGPVAHGRHVGTTLGFPTANIDTAKQGKVMPRGGVYAAIAEVGDRRYRAVVNIGSRPTLDNGSDVTTEAFLLDFDGDLYDREVNLQFVVRMRDEKRFSSLTALRDAIAADAESARYLVKL